MSIRSWSTHWVRLAKDRNTLEWLTLDDKGEVALDAERDTGSSLEDQTLASKSVRSRKPALKPAHAKADAAKPKRARARRHHHSVYVVLLSKDVLYERRFKRGNPDYDPQKPCVYVGMTGLSPDVRFDKHKAGIQANKYVKLYGVRLMPELYECYNPMPYDAALDMEVELGIALREKGYGVWQG
jgi:hypothetical protein